MPVRRLLHRARDWLPNLAGPSLVRPATRDLERIRVENPRRIEAARGLAAGPFLTERWWYQAIGGWQAFRGEVSDPGVAAGSRTVLVPCGRQNHPALVRYAGHRIFQTGRF